MRIRTTRRAGGGGVCSARAWHRASGLARPGVAQGDAAVEHRLAGGMVVAVGDEVADALELERLLRRGLRGSRFDVAGDDAARIGVHVVLVGLAAFLVV